jgi:hypothetical protein
LWIFTIQKEAAIALSSAISMIDGQQTKNRFDRGIVEMPDFLGKAIGEFRRPRCKSGCIDHDTRVRDLSQSFEFLGLIPDDVEENDGPLHQKPSG